MNKRETEKWKKFDQQASAIHKALSGQLRPTNEEIITKLNNERKKRNMKEVLKVSSKTSPNKVAGAIAGTVREHGEAELQAIGAGAVNQAMKAIAIARTFLIINGIDLICAPSFKTIEIDGEEKTAMCLMVRMR